MAPPCEQSELLLHGPPASEASFCSIGSPLRAMRVSVGAPPPLSREASFCRLAPLRAKRASVALGPPSKRSELLWHRSPYFRAKRASVAKRALLQLFCCKGNHREFLISTNPINICHFATYLNYPLTVYHFTCISPLKLWITHLAVGARSTRPLKFYLNPLKRSHLKTKTVK